ncbi:MAG: preprotein translocase subunit SecG [Oscillospiraceae bacterium]|jgi:preprotein translocase subunit SecG|nr:preprotein translocase subunit SecG [Oscillospiraceae bacterium]
MIFLKIAITILDLLFCVILVGAVIFQSGKTSGLSGALSGGSDTFLSKNKSKTIDARLARATKWIAAIFVVLTVILNLI